MGTGIGIKRRENGFRLSAEIHGGAAVKGGAEGNFFIRLPEHAEVIAHVPAIAVEFKRIIAAGRHALHQFNLRVIYHHPTADRQRGKQLYGHHRIDGFGEQLPFRGHGAKAGFLGPNHSQAKRRIETEAKTDRPILPAVGVIKLGNGVVLELVVKGLAANRRFITRIEIDRVNPRPQVVAFELGNARRIVINRRRIVPSAPGRII